ncbi:MAG: hypothetical protein Q7N50_08445 [Armatimonadota bacterium]|nr:hypothetical protein [Armatimonadota bacterium]
MKLRTRIYNWFAITATLCILMWTLINLMDSDPLYPKYRAQDVSDMSSALVIGALYLVFLLGLLSVKSWAWWSLTIYSAISTVAAPFATYQFVVDYSLGPMFAMLFGYLGAMSLIFLLSDKPVGWRS